MPLIRTTPPLPCAISTLTTLTNASLSSSSTLSAATFGSHLLRKIQNPIIGFSATRNRSRAALIRAKAGADYYSTLNNQYLEHKGRLKFPVFRHVALVMVQEPNQRIALSNAQIAVAEGEK
ncbi:hypothetical protein V8G54_012342 [Vigna mungo]|uniref:Uncharacterized protein n=1 Tax=Vigna mungo TaxID=3915 RepID=A0AAQ3S3Q3_VIGMU